MTAAEPRLMAKTTPRAPSKHSPAQSGEGWTCQVCTEMDMQSHALSRSPRPSRGFDGKANALALRFRRGRAPVFARAEGRWRRGRCTMAAMVRGEVWRVRWD